MPQQKTPFDDEDELNRVLLLRVRQIVDDVSGSCASYAVLENAIEQLDELLNPNL
ncbi:MAG: hypothetical protein WD049_01595 [Candidatus Paceibacterota bacterium]